MKISYEKVFFIVALNVFAKSFQSNSCGSEVYSAYHTHLNMSCYDDWDGDDLPILDANNITNNGIFFIDVSCKGGLNIREACSVEAAANVNAERQVYVLFAGAVNHQCASNDPLASLLAYKNIQLYRIHPEEFASNTGLGHLLRSANVIQSPYPVLYALDLLKFIALYKFGGVYMDMDMLATRPFRELPHRDNWVSIGDHANGMLSAAIMSVSKDAVGKKLAESFISLLKEQHPLDVGSFNVIKEAVESICGVVPFDKTKKGFSFTCQGMEQSEATVWTVARLEQDFRPAPEESDLSDLKPIKFLVLDFCCGLVLYASKFFFPVPCESSGDYLASELDITNLTRSYTQQLCNGLTFDKSIPRKSIYASLMSRYCPKVFNYFDRMGFKEQIEVVENFSDIGSDDNIDQNVRPFKTNGNVNGTGVSKRIISKWFYEVV